MVNLANTFYLVPIAKESQLQYAFTFEGIQYTFTQPPLSYFNNPPLTTIFVEKT